MAIAAILILITELSLATDTLYQWRTSVERVYHEQRTGTKQAFEQTYTTVIIKKLVDDDLHKATLLKSRYGIDVNAAMIAEEIQRINQNTKSPETLAKIKAALGENESAFAETVVKPIIVERLLRQHFYQDIKIHAAARKRAITTRNEWARGEKTVESTRVVLLLKERPPQTAPSPPASSSVRNNTPTYTNEATAQITQALNGDNKDDEPYHFDDLPPEVTATLKEKCTKPGDVSPIFESTSGFTIYRVKELTADHWTVDQVFIPRISYECWLENQ